jgi:hypothetical protein
LRAILGNDPVGKRLPARVGSTDVASIGFADRVVIRFAVSTHDGTSDLRAIGEEQVPVGGPVPVDLEFTIRGSGGSALGTITVPVVGQSRVHN